MSTNLVPLTRLRRLRDGGGLCPFQRRCESALVEVLAARGYELTGRILETPPGNEWVRCEVAGTDISVWIHDDTAGFDSPGRSERFEEWDFATPDDLISAFCQAVSSAVPRPG